jgi:hypothetical protein
MGGYSDFVRRYALYIKLKPNIREPNHCLVSDVLGPDLHEYAFEYLQTLKVVEYVGPASDAVFVLNRVNIRVLVYHMYKTGRSLDLEDTQAEITSMPHRRFEGKWDEWV